MDTFTKQLLLPAAGLAGGALAAAAARRGSRRTRGHPVFARTYAVMARLAEKGELGSRRNAVVSGATGLVLELGAGTGEGFKHYSPNRQKGPSVTGVVAIDPDPTMVRTASRRRHEVPVLLHLVQGRGEALPFRDGAFDTVVATLVLCSVDDPVRSLSELRRVLRPGGRLLFLEHVRAAAPRLARWQDRLEGLWGAFAGGCHPNRPTLETICEAGFEIRNVEHFDLKPGVPIVHPHIQGSAVRP
jgi:SAM-dependent methyltransferase